MDSAWLGLCLFALVGCTADAAVDGDGLEHDVIATVSDPLATGTVQWVNGTYTTCTNRSGAWSARVTGSAAMDNPALTVVKNDTGCKLTLTGLYADQAYTAATPLLLSTSYAATPSSFGAGASLFMGNAKLDATTFAADFQISFVYSGDPPVAASTVSGGYATYTSSVATNLVTPPSYTLDVTGLHFQADVLQLVVGLSGQAVLNNGLVTGSAYAIDSTLGASPTYTQTANAFDAAVLTQKTISGANPTIQAAEFNVLTLSLLGSTQIRNIIVKRTSAGVAAYQIFRVTFIS